MKIHNWTVIPKSEKKRQHTVTIEIEFDENCSQKEAEDIVSEAISYYRGRMLDKCYDNRWDEDDEVINF